MTSPNLDWAEEVVASSAPARVEARVSYVYDISGIEPESGISVSLFDTSDGSRIISWAGFLEVDQAREIARQIVAERQADHLAEAADPINRRPRVPGLLS